jgi:hypothetical protein
VVVVKSRLFFFGTPCMYCMRFPFVAASLTYYLDNRTVNFAFPLTNTITSGYVCVKSEYHIPFDVDNSHGIDIELDTTNTSFSVSGFPPLISYNLIDDIYLDATLSIQSTVSLGDYNIMGLSLPAVYRSLQEIDGEQQCSWTSPWTCR